LFLFAVIDNYELKSTEEGVFKKFPANKKDDEPPTQRHCR
jgi:hypothetical protein